MKRRVGRLLLGVVGATLLLAVAGIGETRNGGLAVFLVAAAMLWWAVSSWVARRRPIRGDGWTPTAAISFRPAAARPTASPGAVARALARVEARELVTSPAFGTGLGFCLLMLWLFGWVWVGDYAGNLPLVLELAPILIHPLAGMVVLATFRARTRGRRDGVEELYETCPTSQSTRSLGALLTGWTPAVVAAVFLLALIGLILLGSPPVYGDVGARQAADVLGAAVLCLGATALGVALARWTPWTLAPVAAVIAVGFGAVSLATQGTRPTDPLRQLSTFLGDPEVDLRLTAPHWLAHHLWIVALAAMVAVLAVLRDKRGPIVLGAGALAVAVAVASGVAATRPIDASDAQRIATLVSDPSTRACVDAGGFDVCTYEGDDDLANALVGEVLPIATTLPGKLDGWSVRQGADTDWRRLDPEVVALSAEPAVDDHLIDIEFTGHPLALEGLRIWAGLAATGVLDDRVPDTTLSIRGEARGALSLWLATRGASETAQLNLTSIGNGGRTGRDRERPWPDTCFAGTAPVRWATSDVAAARKMLSLPEAEITAAVLADWDHLTAPETTTDDLMAALGLEPVGLEGQTLGTSEC